jgi:hypothetical protein
MLQIFEKAYEVAWDIYLRVSVVHEVVCRGHEDCRPVSAHSAIRHPSLVVWYSMWSTLFSTRARDTQVTRQVTRLPATTSPVSRAIPTTRRHTMAPGFARTATTEHRELPLRTVTATTVVDGLNEAQRTAVTTSADVVQILAPRNTSLSFQYLSLS